MKSWTKKIWSKDYNIYVFHGTDGDDWDTDGKESLPELKKMLDLCQPGGHHHCRARQLKSTTDSEVERYL